MLYTRASKSILKQTNDNNNNKKHQTHIFIWK